MEEDINILEEFRKSIKNFNNYADNTNISLITKKQVKAIENLIARNKELEEVNNLVQYIRVKDMPKDTLMVCMCNDDFCRNFGNDYILKSKVKEKIEEIKGLEDIPKEIDFKAYYRVKDLRNIQIQVLQELLD